jgi:hypothetical protein
MTSQPPPEHRMTWVDNQNRYWRVDRVAGRWTLSLYSPPTEMWMWIGDFSSKSAAVQSAYAQDPS